MQTEANAGTKKRVMRVKRNTRLNVSMLEEQRVLRRWSYDRMADEIQANGGAVVDGTNLHQWLTGKHAISWDSACDIADVFRLPMDQLKIPAGK